MTPRGHIAIGNFRECFSELPVVCLANAHTYVVYWLVIQATVN